MILDGALGNGDSLLTNGVRVEMGFSLARVTEPPAQGKDVGSVTLDDLMLESQLVEPRTPTGTPNHTGSG